jgi:hypothetical protein
MLHTPQQLFIAPERTEMLSQLNLGLQFTRLQVPSDGNFNELNNNQFESDAPPDVITDVAFLIVPAHTELAPLPGYSVLLPELLSLLHSSSITTGDDVQQSEVDVDDDVQVDALAAANDEGSVSNSERVFLCVKMEPLGEGASPLTELAVRT